MNRSRRAPSVGPAQRSTALPSLCAGLCLLLAPLAPAHAAKWQNVTPGGKSTQARVDIDTASIDRAADGKVRAWHREVYPAQRLQESWAFSYASVTQLSEFHCDKRSVAPVRRLYLAADGSELKSEGFDGKDATPVVPDTPQERVLNHLCRKPSAPLPAAAAPQMPAPAAATPAATEQTPGKARGKGQKEEAPPPPPPKPPAPWSYDGKLGPAKWSKLSDDYALCGDGKRQSPIDIRTPIRADLAPIRFAWQSMPLAIVDTGHGMQVNADGGTIVVDGEEYQLQHFRFHHPGETMVNGKRAVMSVQFEHRSPSGRIAVLAVPLVEGKENRLARTLLSALPLEPGKVASPAGVKIDPGQLIPQKRDYATYVGSLTTPPCTEGVLWLVMKHPVSVSREQIADFAKIYKNNVRPMQAANGRVIKESR